MSERHTPPTDEVREKYKSGAWLRADDPESAWKPEVYEPRYFAEFDRWLAAEKAKWQAEATQAIDSARYPTEEFLCAEDAYWRAIEDAKRAIEKGADRG